MGGDSSKMEGEDFSCQHYRRKSKFVTPCCDGLYRCRFCHDEEQSHTLRRDDVTMVECSQCGVSMMDMTDVWKIYDKEISETPMPEEYVDLYAAIQCRDCFKPSLSRFHILGMKCIECGSYNTV